MKKLKRMFFSFAIVFFAIAAFGQTVDINKKPLTIAPGAEVGNKIRLKWNVMKDASVVIQVADKNGTAIRTLDAGRMQPGEYSVVFDGKDLLGRNLTPGQYIVRVGINPKPEADTEFGIGGMLGKVFKKFKFEKERAFNLGVKGIDPKTVRVFVDGEEWDREEDFSIAGDNFIVDGTNGIVKLNPQGLIQDKAEVEISYAVGLPLENPWALAAAPDGNLFISDNLFRYDAAMKKPKPRAGLIYKVSPTGRIVDGFGSRGILESTSLDLAVDDSGNIYTVPPDHYVAVLDPKGVKRMGIAGYNSPHKEGQPYGGYWVTSIALDRQNMRILLVNINETNVIYDATKPGFEGYIAVQTPKEGYLLPPVYWQYWGPCADAFNDDFYQTVSNHALVKFHLDIAAKKVSPVWNTPYQDPTGQTEISSAPGTLWHGMGVRADGTGLIYVANRNNHRIEIFFDAGISYKYVANIGSKGEDAKQCQMMAPHALALSPDKKALYVADDGIFIKHGKEPVNKGLARVTKVKLGFEETLEVPLVVK